MINLAIVLGSVFGMYLLALQRLDDRKTPPRRYAHQVIRECLGAVGVAAIVSFLAGVTSRNWQANVADTRVPIMVASVLLGIPLVVGIGAVLCASLYMACTFFIPEKTLLTYPPRKVGVTVLFAVTALTIVPGYLV